MQLYRKIKKNNGRRQIYILGIKVCSYQGKNLRIQKKRKQECEARKSLKETGINTTTQRSPRVIVSLTSYHLRINSIYPCLYSLLTQTEKPDELILWLANDNFPRGEIDLPRDILSLKKNGLTIKWYSDIRSYKKLIPALKYYPDDIVVTADDDIIYSQDWLQKLYCSYLQYPQDISVHRVTRFEYHGEWVVIGHVPHSNGSYLNKLTGCGGVLYPPRSLYQDVINEELFTQLALTNDDLWFWFQAILNNIKIRMVEDFEQDLIYTNNSQEVGLTNINDHGENLFWKDFDRLIKYYPIVEYRMKQELSERGL